MRTTGQRRPPPRARAPRHGVSANHSVGYSFQSSCLESVAVQADADQRANDLLCFSHVLSTAHTAEPDHGKFAEINSDGRVLIDVAQVVFHAPTLKGRGPLDFR